MPITFELPPHLTALKLIDILADKVDSRFLHQQFTLKTYYDSFDWRLYKQGIICELSRSKDTSTLSLYDRKTQRLLASSAILDIPAFVNQFNPGKVRKILEPILDMRALIAISTIECETFQLEIFSANTQITQRLIIEECPLFRNRLTLLPHKGQEKVTDEIAEIIKDGLNLQLATQSLFSESLQLQGRNPKDYSDKVNPHFPPDIIAKNGCQLLFSQLLNLMKTNEQGVINDIDSEFLHDFRVAVRNFFFLVK
jgi:hypothetical protein